MRATISADIVSSTSLKTEDLISLTKELKGLMDGLENEIKGFWGRIVKGDSIECYFEDDRMTLRVALLLKLRTKMFASQVECAEATKRQGLRFAIGAGSMKVVSKDDDLIDGEAIYISGRAIQKSNMKLDDAYQAEHNEWGDVSLQASIVSLLDWMVGNYTAKQCEVVYWKLRGWKETDIAKKLKVKQPTVNSRSTSAGWSVVDQAVKAFEDELRQDRQERYRKSILKDDEGKSLFTDFITDKSKLW